MPTEKELQWMRQVLLDYKPEGISPSYIYRVKTIKERNENKDKVRKELDKLRKSLAIYTPEALIELKSKSERINRGINDFSGVYIIFNRTKNLYYAGQSKSVFDRAYEHFITDPATLKGRIEWTVEFNLPEIFYHYRKGDKFIIHLIPIEKTNFSSLNEFEDYAIRAYNSLVPNGYNRTPGVIMDVSIFPNEETEKVAKILLEKMKSEDVLSKLTNDKLRRNYLSHLLMELELPSNTYFNIKFVDFLRRYQNAIKKKKK